MSRSRRRTLVCKQKNDKFYKRYSNKVFRKRDIELSDIKPNRLVNAYDISDYRFWVDESYKARMK